jgi:hypothetical protein
MLVLRMCFPCGTYPLAVMLFLCVVVVVGVVWRSGNDIGVKGAAALAEALKVNTALTSLVLYGKCGCLGLWHVGVDDDPPVFFPAARILWLSCCSCVLLLLLSVWYGDQGMTLVMKAPRPWQRR